MPCSFTVLFQINSENTCDFIAIRVVKSKLFRTKQPSIFNSIYCQVPGKESTPKSFLGEQVSKHKIKYKYTVTTRNSALVFRYGRRKSHEYLRR